MNDIQKVPGLESVIDVVVQPVQALKVFRVLYPIFLFLPVVVLSVSFYLYISDHCIARQKLKVIDFFEILLNRKQKAFWPVIVNRNTLCLSWAGKKRNRTFKRSVYGASISLRDIGSIQPRPVHLLIASFFCRLRSLWLHQLHLAFLNMFISKTKILEASFGVGARRFLFTINLRKHLLHSIDFFLFKQHLYIFYERERVSQKLLYKVEPKFSQESLYCLLSKYMMIGMSGIELMKQVELSIYE